MNQDIEYFQKAVRAGNIHLLKQFNNVLEYVEYKKGVLELLGFLESVFKGTSLLSGFEEAIKNDHPYNVTAFLQSAQSPTFRMHQQVMKETFLKNIKQMGVLTGGAVDWDVLENDSGATAIFLYFKPDLVRDAVLKTYELIEAESRDEDEDTEVFSMN